MKHNKPDARQLAEVENKSMLIAASKESEVQKYLDTITLEGIPEDHMRIYKYIRTALVGELGAKGLARPTFAALIERIARTSVYLQIIETKLITEDMFKEEFSVTPSDIHKNTDYMRLQKEHRDCIELFANLMFAEENKRKKKVLEELRKQVSFEE